MVVIFILLVWQLCVGPSGIVATRQPLSSDFQKHPFEVVFSSCVFLDYWAGLLKSEDQEAMPRGATMLKDNANLMRICAAAQDDGARN